MDTAKRLPADEAADIARKLDRLEWDALTRTPLSTLKELTGATTAAAVHHAMDILHSNAPADQPPTATTPTEGTRMDTAELRMHRTADQADIDAAHETAISFLTTVGLTSESVDANDDPVDDIVQGLLAEVILRVPALAQLTHPNRPADA